MIFLVRSQHWYYIIISHIFPSVVEHSPRLFLTAVYEAVGGFFVFKKSRIESTESLVRKDPNRRLQFDHRSPAFVRKRSSTPLHTDRGERVQGLVVKCCMYFPCCLCLAVSRLDLLQHFPHRRIFIPVRSLFAIGNFDSWVPGSVSLFALSNLGFHSLGGDTVP